MDFRPLRDRRDLAAYLATSDQMVSRIVHAPDDELFLLHAIPKRGAPRARREVWSIRHTDVADVYKGLARRLWAFLCLALPGFPHAAAHGYVPGRSTLTNAGRHLGADKLLHADIHAFFRSITRDRVVSVLRQAGLGEEGASALAGVVVRDNHVPLGLNTSPIIANAVCHELDPRLVQLAPGGTYTRYADDLTFSGPHLPEKKQVAEELAGFGFTLAEEKWRVARRGRGLYVTGLSLEKGDRPRAPRRLKRRLRQELHHAALFGLAHHIGRRGYASMESGINKIDGTIRYVRGIEPELGRSLLQAWQAILAKEGQSAGYSSREPSTPRDVLFLLDESQVDGAEGQVLLLALTVVEDPELVRDVLAGFLAELRANPYGGTPADVLDDEGLHWNTLTPDDRTEATKRIRALPFRSFVAYSPLPSGDRDTYDRVYRALLSTIIEGRFIRYDGCRVKVLAEENSKVKPESVADIVRSSYERLAMTLRRRPIEEPACATVAKASDAALPLPDLLLGVFIDYARSAINAQSEAEAAAKSTKRKRQLSGAQAQARFEQIRDKIRAIYDVGTGAVCSRRNPFRPWRPT